MSLNVNLSLNNTPSILDYWDFDPPKPFILSQANWYLNVYINGLCCGIISLFGTSNNIVNMVIFYRLGLHDSMSISLFSLAVTDFTLCIVVFIYRVVPIWNIFFDKDDIDVLVIWHCAFEWAASSLFLCSGWITTYLALERCACVRFPFKVKSIFTRKHSIIVVIVIYLCSAAIYMPVYTTTSLGWLDSTEAGLKGNTNETSDSSRPMLNFKPDQMKIMFSVNIITGYILPFFSLTVLIGSVIGMIHGLKTSSKRRNAMTHARNDDTESKKEHRMNYKSRKLIKVVLFLAIIFTMCTIPRTFAMNMHIFLRRVKHNDKERNLHYFQWLFTNFANVINSSVNIFVYMIVNSSYRKKFKSLFCCYQKK